MLSNHHSTDNAIKNHWNSSMRRKIEKYLSEKQGVDVKNICYLPDGRFDFMGDINGVLAAVRGSSAGGGRGSRTSKAEKKRKALTEAGAVANKKMLPLPLQVPSAHMNLPPKQYVPCAHIHSHPHTHPHALPHPHPHAHPHPHYLATNKENYPPHPLSVNMQKPNSTLTPKRNVGPNIKEESLSSSLLPLNPFEDDGALSPSLMMNLSPQNSSPETLTDMRKDVFSSSLLSPAPSKKEASVFSPPACEMTPLSMVRDNLVKTPLEDSGPFLFSPEPELNRKLFTTGDSEVKDDKRCYKPTEVAVSPIHFSMQKSDIVPKSYFTKESLEGPIEILNIDDSSEQHTPVSQNCLAVVPLKTSMNLASRVTSNMTPPDLPIATPSVNGSTNVKSHPPMAASVKTESESISKTTKRSLFTCDDIESIGDVNILDTHILKLEQ